MTKTTPKSRGGEERSDNSLAFIHASYFHGLSDQIVLNLIHLIDTLFPGIVDVYLVIKPSLAIS